MVLLKDKDLFIPSGVSLADFLSPKLAGSTLAVRKISDEEVYVESGEIIQIHLIIDKKAKEIFEDLYSQKWGRHVTVEQIGGSEFLELQAEEELHKENFEETAEDVLLAIDLVASWAKVNKLTVAEKKEVIEGESQIGSKPVRKSKADSS